MQIRNIPAFPHLPVLLLTAALLAAGCESILPKPHRIDIQQGNAIDEEDYDQIRVGMTRDEVVQLIGLPVLQHPFRADRWDYIYRLKPGKGRLRESRLTLYFQRGVVIKIDDEEYREY